MSTHLKRLVSASIILIIGVIAGCSFFNSDPFTVARSYFSETTIAYQEVNLSTNGNFKALTLKYPVIKSMIEGFIEKAEDAQKDTVDFKKEIAPLINGYYALGIELNNEAGSSDKITEVLLYGETINPGLFKPLIEKIKSNLEANQEVTENSEEYSGYTITSWNFIGSDNNDRSIAFVELNDSAILVSNNVSIIKKALQRNVKKETNITHNTDFSDQFKAIDTDKMYAGFFNLEQYRKFTKNLIDMQSGDLSPEEKAQLENNTWLLFRNPLFTAMKSVTLYTEVTREGIALNRKSNIDHAAYTEDQRWKNVTGDLFKYIPSQNYVWYYGEDLKLNLDLAKSILEADPIVSTQIKQFEKASAIDLEKDLFSWMRGEYAFFVMPPKPFPDASPVQSALLVTVEDTTTALKNLQKIEPVIITVSSPEVRNEIAREGNKTDATVNFSEETINNTQVRGYQFTDQIDMGVYYGVIPNTQKIFIASSKNTVVELLNAEKNNITQNEFVADIVSKGGHAYAYGINTEVIMNEMLPFIEATSMLYEDATYSEKIKPALQSIKYIKGRGILTEYGVESAMQIILQ